MKKQIMLGGLLLLLGSCTPQNKANDPNAIDIAVSLEHLTELKTSQLGKQIRYIPLETTDSSLIGNSYSIKLSKDHIFVSTNGRCLSFNKQTGKYLGSIGHKGEDKSVDLVYNKENNTWNAVADGQSFELVKMNEDGTAVLSLQNGTSMTVTPDAQGIATARIATGNSLFFAAR